MISLFSLRKTSLLLIFTGSVACQSLSREEIKKSTLTKPMPMISDQSPLLDEANEYAKDGLYREAVAAFRKYLAESPKDATAHRTLGIVYVKTGAYKNAIQHLEDAISRFPDNFEANYYLAEAYRTQNRLAEAIFYYNKALRIEPKNIAALKALAWSNYSIRYYSEALKTAKILKKIDPNDFQIAIINARILNKIGLNEKALQLLNKSEALASPEELPFLFSVKGDILFDQGEKNGAEQAYRKALQDQPLLPGALTGLAKKFIAEQQSIDLAITYLERALRIRSNLPEAYFLLGQAYESKDPKKSNENYKMFVRDAALDPEFHAKITIARDKIAMAGKSKKDSDPEGPGIGGEELENAL